MRGVVIREGAVQWGEVPDPQPGIGEVLVRIRASALNRADLLQARGLYPPPPGESEVPGLECAGEIETLGEGIVGPWRVGQTCPECGLTQMWTDAAWIEHHSRGDRLGDHK